ncbi:Predicted lipoprotein [Tenacibaculum sp. MAR_2009_124]|uniref:imelysin family protein n=1 Tax=Tenacibaculum sp. MAR_2009_124 TaxID=1250059 RepID=UPI000894FE20|nr:imelysin family protein [Tenacibaculum sp. MAR_2009_124]SEB50123.1 Predicted lipoprotein [Tenacibaculum sp. MAR_2009_124]
MVKRLTFIAILIVIILAAACSSESDNQNSFDIQQLRADFINLIEQPTTTLFTQNIRSLHTTITSFSNNTSIQNLQAVKEAWKKAAEAFSSIEPYNIGEIKNSNIQTSFYTWGADDTGINAYIASTNTIDQESINSLPTTQRGLSAIEFLLFEFSEQQTVESFMNTRRINYLSTLGENLVSKSNIYKTLWENTRNDFIQNNQTGINGSMNQIVNQMYALLEDIKSLKIGEPAGIERTSNPDSELLQAEKSSYSLNLIKENIESIKSLYFGNANGLDDYIFSKTNTTELNDEITKTFNNIESAISSLNHIPLNQSIFNKPTEVQNLYNTIRDLLILMKVDVADVLSITITVTDNDGD